MKAIIYKQYGPPEVAYVAEVEKPVCQDNEVLIKVYASTVNRTDAGFRSAEYFVSRFWSGLIRPKYPVLGCEFAGIIEVIGKAVTTFQPGDKVFAFNANKFGGHAEYVSIGELEAIATLPNNLTYTEAAPITEGAHYALNAIRAAKIRSGEHVMVYGATGAIGSAAVQLLKHYGMHVTAVCNTKNIDLVKNLGADIVIDYEKTDFTKTDNKYQFILDAVGKSSYGQCKPLLAAKGIYISTELGKNGENIFYALTSFFSNGKKLLFPIPTINQIDVNFLKGLVEKSEYRPVIDRSYPLEQIVDAYRYVETGQKTGNVVITVQH